MDVSANKSHYIKFTTSEWGKDEYIFNTDPIINCQNTGIDHHVQCKIVEYMNKNNIKGKDYKFIYYDDNMNEILHNDTALEHGTFELPNKK